MKTNCKLLKLSEKLGVHEYYNVSFKVQIFQIMYKLESTKYSVFLLSETNLQRSLQLWLKYGRSKDCYLGSKLKLYPDP